MTTEKKGSSWTMLGLVVAGTVLAIMGTDLILPAVPYLPETLGGSPAQAQFVLAAYVGGSCVGLLGFGALGDRFQTGRLFVGSLLATAAAALACSVTTSLPVLIALRAVQGAVAAGPAVFAPGIVKATFDDRGAVRALGLLGSIEALAPALAPLLGAWLIVLGGWQLTFELLAALAVLLAVAIRLVGRLPQITRRPQGSYGRLLRDPVFLRHASSQALVLGGLLTFVFSMPSLFVHVLGGRLQDFIVMQICGIASFMLVANSSHGVIDRWGAERIIFAGTAIAAVGAAGLLTYALFGGTSAIVITALFVPFNLGLGLRGPPGFYRAVLAARGDDARGAALVILFILGVTTVGTAAVAPFIERGMIPLTAVAFALQLLALLCLLGTPRLQVNT